MLPEFRFMGKRIAVACILSAMVAVGSVYTMIKEELSCNDAKIQNIDENSIVLTKKIDSLAEKLEELETSLNTLQSEWTTSKENSSYVSTTLTSMKKDVLIIKEKLNIENEPVNKQIEKLSTDKKSFIDAFENLIKDGAPFDSFLESNKTKIDMTKYRSADALIKLSTQNIKSLTDLKKDYTNVGNIVFETHFEESFWEKQKRIIKEKISEAIKFRRFNEESTPLETSTSEPNRTKYEKAGEFLSEEKYDEAIKILNSMKVCNENYGNLLIDLKKRWELEKAFAEFKCEFIDAEIDISLEEKH